MPFTAVSSLVATHMDLCLKQTPAQWAPIPDSLFQRTAKLLKDLQAREGQHSYTHEQLEVYNAAMQAFQSKLSIDVGTLSVLRDFFEELKRCGEDQITQLLS